MQRRQEILNDMTDTVGAAFMGMTYGCARCHDHKFDPILHADYYRLQAFFANTRADDDAALLSPTDRDKCAKQQVWEDEDQDIRAEMRRAGGADPGRCDCKDTFDKYPPEIQAAITKPASRAHSVRVADVSPRRSCTCIRREDGCR